MKALLRPGAALVVDVVEDDAAGADRGFDVTDLHAPRESSLAAKTLAVLERIEARLQAGGTAVPPATPVLLDKKQAAALLGVSPRWVERHITPVAQKARRGRAWYSEADIQRQIASFSAPKSDAVAVPERTPHRARMSGRMARAVEIGEALRRKGERRS